MTLQSDGSKEGLSQGSGFGGRIHILIQRFISTSSCPEISFQLTLCASSSATTRPMPVWFSKKMLKQMLNNAQAPSGVTQGQERSTIVSDPA